MLSPEDQAKIAIIRQKAIAGALSLDEQREAILMLRASRKSSAFTSDAARRSKAKKEVKSADELLNELEGL